MTFQSEFHKLFENAEINKVFFGCGTNVPAVWEIKRLNPSIL